MNTKLIVAAMTFGFASVTAHAAGHNDTPTLDTINANVPRFVVNCHDEKLPGYVAIGNVLDTNNAGVLYDTRQAMHRVVEHECAHGIDHVAFVATAAVPDQTLRIAAIGQP
jgi:hypothetical protein